MKYPLRILVVEDNPTDRELLRYLLESRFADQVKFFEAPTLAAAFALSDHSTPSCVILDLQLPDSTGKSTFLKLYERVPRTTPIIVMTHNNDRQLALEMIQAGAADYIIKNFTDDEELFRRIVFSIEKHERMVPLPAEDAVAINRLEKVKASVAKAKRTNSVPNMYAANMEAAEAIAEVSQRMISELSKVSQQLTEVTKTNAQHGVVQEHLQKSMEALEQELLRGHSGRPSMRSQVDLMDHRMGAVEMGMQSLKNNISTLESAQQKEALEIRSTKVTAWTKILVGILVLIGAVASAIATYQAAVAKSDKPAESTPK